MEKNKISFYCWLPKDGFSGGRYLSLCLANAIANHETGTEVDFYTNEVKSHMSTSCFPNSKVNFKYISSQSKKYNFGIIVPNGPGDTAFYRLFQQKCFSLNDKNIFYNFESGNWWNEQSIYKKDIRGWDSWKQLAKRSDCVLSISKTGNYWAKKFYDCKNFIYEPGPINVKHESSNPVKKKQVFIMSRVGSSSKHKGWRHLSLLNTDVLSGYKVIINTGNISVNQAMKRDITTLFAQNNIEVDFLYSISEQEKTNIMKESSFLFFATDFEGLGMPPLEAISLGTNVLCSDIPVLRETGNDVFFFFDNESKNIDNEIKNVLENKLTEEQCLSFYKKHSMDTISNSFLKKIQKI